MPTRRQTHETEVPVEVREWIGPAPTSSDFVLVAQPPEDPLQGCHAAFACASLVYMLSPLPRRSDWDRICSITQSWQPSPIWQSGRPAHRPFRGLLGVHSRYGLHTRAVTVCRDTLDRRLQRFRYLHRCSGCFRLEQWPGGACTHWKSAAFSRRTPEADVASPVRSSPQASDYAIFSRTHQ